MDPSLGIQEYILTLMNYSKQFKNCKKHMFRIFQTKVCFDEINQYSFEFKKIVLCWGQF